MSVTTPTMRLVAFLNYAYSPLTRSKSFQNRIHGLLLPLLDPLKQENIEFYLATLIGQINQMELRPRWVVTPTTVRGVRPGERILIIQGTRWIVGKTVLAHRPFESVYLDILSSLESGEFGRLRRCPECQKFFVEGHLKNKLCDSAKCKRLRDNRTSKIRVQRKRERDARNKKTAKTRANRADQARKEQLGFQNFCEYMQLRGRKMTKSDSSRLGQITKQLPRKNKTPIEWDKQLSKSTREDLWKGFSPETKEIFITCG